MFYQLKLAHQCYFGAIREFNALDAIGPYLMGELRFINDLKAVALEKLKVIGQNKHAGYT